MDEVSVVIPSGSNLSNRDWFLGAIEEDAVLSLSLDASQSGLFNGNFVPPPPRPLFLDDGATSDGLTTCDLCTWAWQNEKSFKIDKALEAPAELGWVLTLVIVSITSAVLGAIIMIIFLHCRSRLKNANPNEPQHQATNTRLRSSRPPINLPDEDKAIIQSNNFSNNQNNIWSWLSRRTPSTPSQLDNPQSIIPAENHYTHMEDNYNSVGDEALYAELDRESTLQRDSPAYQNSAYTDPDAPTSSAPSSAYYSDLSVTTTAPDRVYEVVGMATMPIWDNSNNNNGNMAELRRQSLNRLAAISENVNVPSDYV